jgi:ribonucleoside-diphosphate reductase alpha chain
VPRDATVEEVERAYIESWRLGAKAISIYRDGSKRTQPLNTSRAGVADTRNVVSSVNVASGVNLASGFSRKEEEPVREVVKEVVKIVERPARRKLPDERNSITHKFDVAGHEGYITVGLFEDGTPGEIFLVMAKEGSTISGFADAFAQAISYALQYGVPLQTLVDKFSHSRFEPSGMTKNPEVRFAKSIVDYIFRWMATKFLSHEAQFRAGVNLRNEGGSDDAISSPVASGVPSSPGFGGPTLAQSAEAGSRKDPTGVVKTAPYAAIQNQEDAPPCSTCGSIMIRSGSCYKCPNCGTTSGCA